VLSVALVLFSLVVTAAQAGIDPSLFQELKWRSIGPFRGGRVLAVAGVPSEPLHFYFGAVNGGVWETRDAGRTWSAIFDKAGVGSIGALAIAPSKPQIVYVGTGEADMRSDIAQGIGMFRSDDAGRHWRAIGLSDTQQIGKILVDPRNPDVVLVAALGHPYGPNSERGVFRSVDGGKSWTKTLFRNADTGAIDLVFRPGNPDIVYGALWQTRRPPWNVYPPSNGPGSGLYKSTDNGRSWTQIAGHGLPKAPGRIGLAIAPGKPDRIFALIDGDQAGLYRSDNAGANWDMVGSDPRIFDRAWYFAGVAVNPKNADEVYVCDTIVLRSMDGGRHFLPLKGDPTGDDFHTLWFDPANPDKRILGSDQGAQITLNGGVTWSSWYNQPTGQFYHVITDNRFPYRVYGAQQDSGAAGVPSRTGSIDGIAMPEFHEIAAGGESDNIAPDPEDPDIVYGGRVDRLDLRSGQIRNVDPVLAFPGRYRGTWTLPLVFGPRDHALYFGNQRIFRTVDDGRHWQPISPDLTRPNPGVPANLDASAAADEDHIGARRGVVYAIGPSPRDAHLIWAGTDDGLVWRTTDGGAHWQNVTPRDLAAWSKIGTIEPSHFSDDAAYIAVDRHRLDDFAPYIFRTRDGGRSWTPIASGIAIGGVLNAVNVVREDPLRPGLLYAGTERGLFVSFDDGGSWQGLQNGLPPTSVRDIEIHGDDLVIATHGRGFYIMDDIAPLRELADDPSRGARLFLPAVAYRVRHSEFTGTPMPKDEPLAPNPPDGAPIDYVLPARVNGPVGLTIFDAGGEIVRRFSSDRPAPPPDISKIKSTPDWIPVPIPLRASPGEHRFVWDLHYATGLRSEEPEHQAKGVWAPPGRYEIVLGVNGTSLRQKLTLNPDPRIRADTADYRREFELARSIENARIRIQASLREAKGLHGRLSEETAKAAPLRKSQLAMLDARLLAFAEIPADEVHHSYSMTLHSPSSLEGLSDDFEKLAAAVDGSDGGPTPDAQSGLRRRVEILEKTLLAWKELKVQIDSALAKE
jgi:photosystem II stability/assembly factor-like uncharacterized protein